MLGGEVVGGEVVGGEVLEEDVLSDVVGPVVAVVPDDEDPEPVVVAVSAPLLVVVDVAGIVVTVLCDELPVAVPAAYWLTTACSCDS